MPDFSKKQSNNAKANMNALPVISHHLFVAAIEEPGSRPSKVDEMNVKAVELEVLDWTQPVPERAGEVVRPSSPSSDR